MLIYQSTATRHIPFFMADSSDHTTGKTGLSPTVTISKNCGAFASPSGAITEIANGWYKLAANATDSNTLGALLLHATGTGADATDDRHEVGLFNPDDAVRMGLTALPNANAEAAGGLYTRGTGAGQINQDGNGRIDGNVKAINGSTTGAANLAKTTPAIARGTVDTGGSTTSVPTSAFTPAGAVADQFKNRVVLFDADTTTTALRGQAAVITASNNAATPTLTVGALTTAPASGDTFSVI